MAQLCGNSIHERCHPGVSDGVKKQLWCVHPKTGELLPMISPFLNEKTVVNGNSAGLSHASYDLRIAHDLTLGPHPGHILALRLLEAPQWRTDLALDRMRDDLRQTPPSIALAHTIEDVAIPHDLVGYICDKSTYARVFVSAFNTLFDPGFIGNCTIELVNLSDEPIVIKAGDPFCQMVFHKLDRGTRPYDGKYQFQPKAPVAAKQELSAL